MQVWNMLHMARWKYRIQNIAKNSPSGHHRTTLSGYIVATKSYIDNRKKSVKQEYLLHMAPQYGELRPTNGWDRFGSLGHPENFNKFRTLAASLHGTLVVGVSQTTTLNRRRHLYLAGRPSRWALAHILVWSYSGAGVEASFTRPHCQCTMSWYHLNCAHVRKMMQQTTGEKVEDRFWLTDWVKVSCPIHTK